jgi:hypothetical protein
MLGGVIATMYLNGSSIHAGLTIVYPCIGVCIGVVGVNTLGSTCVK